LSLGKRDLHAHVAFFPSDHYFADDGALLERVDAAFRVINQRPDLVVLLGIVPDGPEIEYGWIEPAESVAGLDAVSLFRVYRFWEKPALKTAERLFMRGCLWNSFIIIASVHALLRLLGEAVPEIYQSFEDVLRTLGTPAELRAVRRVYSQIPSADFSRQVLAACPEVLTVLPVFNAGWIDIGSPDRASSVVARDSLGAHPPVS
jgi:mannose-1-phosphate guanylyltransferase